MGVFVHDKALCESEHVGDGTRVWAFAHVMAGAIVGARCNICDHAFVESGAVIGNDVTVKNNVLLWEGVTVEDSVFLGPNVVFTNDRRPRAAFKRPVEEYLVPTMVRQGATIGANATIVCGTTIGEAAFVGAGSVVITDVPARALFIGNPARHIGWVCDCGERLLEDLTCRGCGRAFAPTSVGVGGLAPVS